MHAGALFQVARLTRPARIRCRPNLAFGLQGYNGRPQRLFATSATRLKREHRDYEDAVKIATGEGVDPVLIARSMRKSALPSLFKFMPEGGTEVKRDEGPESAGPSGSVQAENVQSRKGKGRARPELVKETEPPWQLPQLLSRRGSGPALARTLLQSSPVEAHSEATPGPRQNPVGVQLLSSKMHAQIFPGTPLLQPPEELVDISTSHLAAHGLSPAGAAVGPEISMDLPKLEGENIREHFWALGADAAEPYLSMAEEFVKAELPPMPPRWEEVPGWTRYGLDGSVRPVDNLNGEKLVCFDVETLYKLSPYPVMATAASPVAWYSWLSPSIFEQPPAEEPAPREPWDKRTPECYPHDLIPLFEGGSEPAIVVGHNVGYDRARVKEEYAYDLTPTRWLDTLSLHVATRGITSVQRPAWLKHRKTKLEKAEQDNAALEVLLEEAVKDDDLKNSLQSWDSDTNHAAEAKNWEDTTSINSLAEVARLHCGTEVDKSIRDRFGDESIRHASQLRSELDELLTYCAKDVKTTHDVYQVVFPLFLNSCPHPATFAGVLTMGNSFLPVDQSWKEYLKNAEQMYQSLREDVRKALRTLADRLRREGPKEDDPWAAQLDWSPKAARWKDDGSWEGAEPKVDAVAPTEATRASLPAWYAPISASLDSLVSTRSERHLVPLLLRMTCRGYPVYNLHDHHWCFKAPIEAVPDLVPLHGPPVELSSKDANLASHLDTSVFFRVTRPGTTRRTKLAGRSIAKDVRDGVIDSPYKDLLSKLAKGHVDSLKGDLLKCADDMVKDGKKTDWGSQLDWAPTTLGSVPVTSSVALRKAKFGTWPKWYWDLTSAATSKKQTFGELDLTMRKSVAPLLLKMRWHGYPLAYSKEHKWIYRVPISEVSSEESSMLSSLKTVQFEPKAGDERLAQDTEHKYFRVPHKDGEGSNVGNPLSKSFLKAVEAGELSSALSTDSDAQLASAASSAINMNALCSYWISSRERIMNQFVVYNGEQGMILPQVITMGTVTRRAVEATWLTASNAKKNRVGSELKAMVRAPPGYAIVGADVDSEELWISSVMGDSQFGVHGATAIGWMTLEGTKSAGTDLHSKTASILNISRDGAKVFNYSRIYGAGKPHAIQLLLQGDGKLTPEAADKLAANLYKQTKGSKTFRSKGLAPAGTQYLWHGGSESYLFNTLETIALMDRPTTPALGCGVSRALRKSFLDAKHSYLPSRINWVVQSSGVDYLHLLITSMDYLCKRYGINARYLISVHDEVRYLATEEDKYRAALALQVANAWTRALFCYNLGLDDMPQGIAFFSAVDIDTILRKETDMGCVTPSHPTALPPGESLGIEALLEKVSSLGPVVNARELPRVPDPGPPVRIFADLASPHHRRFLLAQADTKPRGAKMYLDSLPSMAAAEKKPKTTGFAQPTERVEERSEWNEPAGQRNFWDEWTDADVADAFAEIRAEGRVARKPRKERWDLS